MSEPTGPSNHELQVAAKVITNGVCEAYAAYNNGANNNPKLPGYKWICPIKVYEFDPNVFPWSVTEAQAKARAAGWAKGTMVPREPAAYAHRAGDAPSTCIGTGAPGTPSRGDQLFGFTATSDDGSHNILVLRGTVTMEEAGYDLYGWGTNTGCLLPSQSSNKQYFGEVNSSLFDFYVSDDRGHETSLAASCMSAIQYTSQRAPNAPWYMGAHSLGGAMVSLAALDAVASNLIKPQDIIAMTFGSLHVGNAVFAQSYTARVPWSYRFANLCDFVPSMVSIEPVRLKDPYVHVGKPRTFVWQTWDDWGNHHLSSIYMPIVHNDDYWKLIQCGDRQYPQ